MPITASHAVTLPSTADLAGVMGGLADLASSSSMGMFPANLFPELNASRYGFAPNDNSFCVFHVPKTGGKTPMQPKPYTVPGAYGYSSGSGALPLVWLQLTLHSKLLQQQLTATSSCPPEFRLLVSCLHDARPHFAA